MKDTFSDVGFWFAVVSVLYSSQISSVEARKPLKSFAMLGVHWIAVVAAARG
jgi:hypothetical protein